jgi:hypothetical protein
MSVDAPEGRMVSEKLRYKAWLGYISDIAYDRDGFHKAKDLADLVDELKSFADMALKGEHCPIEGAYVGKR